MALGGLGLEIAITRNLKVCEIGKTIGGRERCRRTTGTVGESQDSGGTWGVGDTRGKLCSSSRKDRPRCRHRGSSDQLSIREGWANMIIKVISFELS